MIRECAFCKQHTFGEIVVRRTEALQTISPLEKMFYSTGNPKHFVPVFENMVLHPKGMENGFRL